MILVVGNLNYEVLFPVANLPGYHEKMTCESAVTGCGGSAANTAWWLGKLCMPVTMSGAVGPDPMGDAQLLDLEKAGVMTTGVNRTQAATGFATIFSLGRDKRMVRTLGANLHASFDKHLLDGCSLVYLSGADTRVLKQFAAEGRRVGATVFCGRHGAQDSSLAALVDGFILNSDEVRELTGLQDPEEGIRALDSKVAAVTLPQGGCLVSEGISVARIPSPELDPVDRTGGGDAFAAGFLAGLYNGLDLEECGKLGNELAAGVIMEVGARPDIGIPGYFKI